MKKPFCVTIDDSTLLKFSSVIGMRKLLRLFREYDIPATFFVIPKAHGVELYYRRDWLGILREAQEQGHELQLHGLEHHCLEFGYPPDSVLLIEVELREKMERERDEIELEMTREKLGKKLREGIDIFKHVFGVRPSGFRSPCASTHKYTFEVLRENGFVYDSSCVVNPLGWHYLVNDYTSEIDWTPEMTPEPYVIGDNEQGLYEIPIMSEYTWYLQRRNAEAHYELMISDLIRTLEYRAGIFVSLAHVNPISQNTRFGDDDTGLELYRRVFEWVIKNNKYEFCTLSDALKMHQ